MNFGRSDVRKLAWIAALGLVAASWAVVPGLAANLSGASQTVGAGNGTIARCDDDGFVPYFILSGSNVASVYVYDIATACQGATVTVTVSNGVTHSSGTTTIPSDGSGTVTVDVAPDIALADSMQTEIVV